MTMYDKQLREIRLFLDSIPGDIDETANSQYCFDLVEEAGISILDSRFMTFENGLLEEFMLQYMLLRRYEYGLVDMDNPQLIER
jgi:hypothetical protein